MKVSPEAVAMRGRKGWKNRHLVCGIVTRLLPALFNFLARAPRAKGNLKSMEQCLEGKAAKDRVLAWTLYRDCSMKNARGAHKEGGRLVARG